MHAFEPQICHSSTGSLGMSQDEQSALQKTLQGFLALSSARVSSQCFTFTFFLLLWVIHFSRVTSSHRHWSWMVFRFESLCPWGAEGGHPKVPCTAMLLNSSSKKIYAKQEIHSVVNIYIRIYVCIYIFIYTYNSVPGLLEVQSHVSDTAPNWFFTGLSMPAHRCRSSRFLGPSYDDFRSIVTWRSIYKWNKPGSFQAL